MRRKPAHLRLLEIAPDELQVLQQRARELAKPLGSAEAESPEANESVELLEIQSRGQMFALPLSVVEGIADLSGIASIPRAPPAIRGMVTFRGEVLLALELSGLIGASATGLADLRRIIVVAAGGLKLAVVAEKVVSIRAARAATFVEDRLRSQGFIVGVDSGFVMLLEPAQLISHAFGLLQGDGR